MSLKIVDYNNNYQEELINFFRENSSDHPELYNSDILKWQVCHRYLALMNDKVVGHIARIPHTFKLKREEINIGWAASLVLDESNDLIRTFAGTSLLNKITDEEDLRFGAVGVVEEIEQTHTRRGFKIERSSIKMYARFFNPSKALAFLNKSKVFSLPILFINQIYSVKKPRTIDNIVKIDSFDLAWNKLWDKYLSEQFRFYGTRDDEFLNHKLRQPTKSYKSIIHINEAGDVDAYLIYRIAVNSFKNIKLLKICDLVGSVKGKEELLKFAVNEAKYEKVDGVIALSSKADEKMFKNCGIWVSKNYPVVLSPKLNAPIQINFFDSDLDNLW